MNKLINLNNKQKTLNFSGFEVEKAAVYADNYKNRKLGRVGRPYDKSEVRKEDKEKDTKLSKTEKRVDVSKISDEKLISITRRSEIVKTASNDQINSFIDSMGFDIDKSKPLRDKKHKLVKEIIDYAELEGSNKEIGESIDEILTEGMEGGFEEKEVYSGRIEKRIKEYTEKYNDFSEKVKPYIDKDIKNKLSNEEKKEFDKLKKEGEDLTDKLNSYKLLSQTKTLKNLNGESVDKIIDYSEFKIDKSLPLEDKKAELIEKYRKSADLGKITKRNIESMIESVDEIIEDALSEL